MPNKGKWKIEKLHQLLRNGLLNDRKEIDLVQICISIENNINTNPLFWTITHEGKLYYERDLGKEKMTVRLHLIYPILYSLAKYGGHFSYELSDRLRKPLFMVQHSLNILSKRKDSCPFYVVYKYRDFGCLTFDKPLVRGIKVQQQ